MELWFFFLSCFWGPQKRSKFWILDLKVCLKKTKHWARLVWKKCPVSIFHLDMKESGVDFVETVAKGTHCYTQSLQFGNILWLFGASYLDRYLDRLQVYNSESGGMYNYRVANKFSDTLNQLFEVNCLISIFFVKIPDENKYHTHIIWKF